MKIYNIFNLFFLICLLLLYSTFCKAESKVIIQNNSSHTLLFKTTTNLGSAYWKMVNTKVYPGERKTLLSFNRDDGIKNGKVFTFTTEVTTNKGKEKTSFILKQKLKGASVGSHMWQSVNGQGWEDEDGEKHEDKWFVGKKYNKHTVTLNVRYWSFFTGGHSDIEYVFQENFYTPPKPDMYSLNILSYNVYMRPIFVNGQSERVNLIPEKVRGYDAIVFNEAFDDDIRAELVEGLKRNGYKYSSKILGCDKGPVQDGGVFIASKWPITKQDQQPFGDHCEGLDCLADKGVLYAKINRNGVDFHLFGTHLNDGNDPVWKTQCKIIRNFIKAQNIPKNYPVIIAGDINIDRAGSNYEEMLKLLHATNVADYPRLHRYTYDGKTNKLIDNPKDRRQLDYILVSNDHASIDYNKNDSYTEVRILKTDEEWKDVFFEKANWELSDHYPIYAHISFDMQLFNSGFKSKFTNLTRYWNSTTYDVANVVSLNKSGYKRIGASGYLFTDKQSADEWIKREVNNSGRKKVKPIKGFNKKNTTTQKSKVTISSKTFMKRQKSIPPTSDILPLELWYNASHKDYWTKLSTTSSKSGYKKIATVGYVITPQGSKKLSPGLRPYMIPIWAYYNSKKKDHLLAINNKELTDAKKRGYQSQGIIGYLIKERFIPSSCDGTGTPCPTGYESRPNDKMGGCSCQSKAKLH